MPSPMPGAASSQGGPAPSKSSEGRSPAHQTSQRGLLTPIWNPQAPGEGRTLGGRGQVPHVSTEERWPWSPGSSDQESLAHQDPGVDQAVGVLELDQAALSWALIGLWEQEGSTSTELSPRESQSLDQFPHLEIPPHRPEPLNKGRTLPHKPEMPLSTFLPALAKGTCSFSQVTVIWGRK